MAASGKTNLTTPIIILVVLVVAAWFAFKPSGDSAGTGEGGGTASGGDSALLVDVDRDAINRLDITKPDGDSFSLLKQDDSWFALIDGEQYLADDMRTSTLLDMLPELKQEAMMSDKPEHHPTFELNDDQAYKLSVYAGGSDPKLTLLVGKSTENMKGCFVRMAGEDPVYRASANLRTSLGYSFSDYRSKQLWAYDPLLATSVTITPVTEDGAFTGEPMSFTKDGELWKLASDGSNGNQNDLKEIVEKFAALRIQSFVDDTSELPLEQYNPEATPCLVVEANGKSYSLSIDGREEGNIVISDTDGRVYKTNRSNLGFLLEQDFSQLSFYEEPVADEAAEGDVLGEDAGSDDAAAGDAAGDGEAGE
ncbi:MAG: DUF4340 domain-containing protein [Planctomycetales bacterium]|nr:DUF4340 domain-containing protein [bacterium]UNM09321.1 MAG: DUF4340 domain-containing protein [Planctomycetales bacterium]